MIINLLIALGLTLLIELIMALFFGFRKIELIVITLVNIITNLTMNYLFMVFNYFNIIKVDLILVLIAEIIVVLVEWFLLSITLERRKSKLFFFSLIANASSYFVGPFLLNLFFLFK